MVSRKALRGVFFLIILTGVNVHLSAQGVTPSLSAQSRVSLITLAPGSELYSSFGHSAFRIEDPEQGMDWTVNYGTFDFNTDYFYLKFAQGRLNYQISINYTKDFLAAATEDHQRVVEQVLDLTLAERQKLLALLLKNSEPENRYYKYDFFYDNCATRLVGILQQTLASALVLSNDYNNGHPQSFRELKAHYLRHNLWANIGMDVLLGTPTDHVATAYEAMFLPDELAAGFGRATLNRPTGIRPLVLATFVVQDFPLAGPEWSFPWPLLIGWVIFMLAAGLTIWQYLNPEARQYALDRFLFPAAGLIGALIFFLMFLSDHRACAANFNILWAMPTLLLAPFLLKVKKRWVRYFFGVHALMALIVLLGWPLWPQKLEPAIFPVVLALALRSNHYSGSGKRFFPARFNSKRAHH